MPRAFLAFACTLSLVLLAGVCAAKEPAITHVSMRWSGHFKRGHWAEVQAEVSAADQPLTGELEFVCGDGDGAAVAFHCTQPVELDAGQSVAYTAHIKMGPAPSGLRVRLRQDSQTLLERALSASELSGAEEGKEKTSDRGHRSTSYLIAMLGADAGVESALKQLGDALGDEAADLPLSGVQDLPKTSLGYDAIDCLLVTMGEENPLATLLPEQQAAMSQWQRLGGRVVIVAGDSARYLASEHSPWADLFGGRLSERSPLKSDTGLRAFAGETIELSPVLQAWQVDAPPERVKLSESGLGASGRPVLVEYPVGLGSLSLVLVDLTAPPLSTWRGRPRFLAKVISEKSFSSEPDNTRGSGRMTHLGYRDLAGQLRMAIDQFEGVTPVHFHPVAGVLLIYLILLGPGEYFLLRTAAPRAMHLTWLLFPLLVLGFAGAAIAWGRSAHGTAVKVNQVEVVDLDPLHGVQRGFFWTGLFSPEAQSVSLSARPLAPQLDATLSGVQLAWQGLPGDGLGGVDVASGLGGVNTLAGSATEPYEVLLGDDGTPAILRRLSLPRASSKTLAGGWQGTIPLVEDGSQLRRGKLLEIEGSFRSIVPVPLKNAFLAHGDWMYRAHNEVRPGETINIANLERKHLEYFFTRRSLLKEKEAASPWNQEEADVARIVDIMMFHAALQGRNYTVLSHRYHGDLDLTHLLREGYAVLVGRADPPAVELQLSGEPLEDESVRRWTYYRILYPVAPRD